MNEEGIIKNNNETPKKHIPQNQRLEGFLAYLVIRPLSLSLSPGLKKEEEYRP